MQKVAPGSILTVLACALAFGLSACGPMNHRPAEPGGGASSGSGGQTQLDSGGSGSLPIHGTQKGVFLVRATLKTDGVSVGGVAPQAKVGDNVFLLRFVQAETMNRISHDAQVTVQYQRLSSHLPKKFNATVQQQEDGSYTAAVTFKKAGNWEVSIHLVDGALQDDYVFQTVLE